jgi:hypothetical protein
MLTGSNQYAGDGFKSWGMFGIIACFYPWDNEAKWNEFFKKVALSAR